MSFARPKSLLIAQLTSLWPPFAAAAPICAVVQTALLGQYVGTAALGAYGAVSVTAGFATRVFNFLVDGVSAKTGKSVGLRAWGELGGRVKMSLGFALGAGIIAACILSALIHPVSVDILKLTDEVQKEAEWYWWLRVGLVPILLLNMSLSGILQGFRHVRVAAGINTCQSLLEMAGSAVVLKYGIPIGGHTGLVSMGVVTMVTQILALIAGLSCILALPPLEANGQFSLWEDWFGGKKEENGVRQPLLDDAALCQHDSVASLHEQSPATNIVKKPARTSIDEATVGSMASTVFGASVEDHHGPALDVRIAVSANGTVQVATPHANGDSVHPPSLPLGSNVLGSHPIPEEDVEAHTVVEWAPEEEQPQDGETMLDFVRDGINMFIRSMILQSTFFATLVAASRLGTPR